MLVDRLVQGLIDTVFMVGVSSFIAVGLGIPLAVLLVVTDRGGLCQSLAVHRVLSAVTNVFRSIPFLILMVALIPFTRWLVGTTFGVWAAIVPLSVAAVPFFARIAEVSLREVDDGLIEAAQAIGCQRRHVIWHVMLAESVPSMVGGLTITVVTLINASAVAGAIGAGGLGDVAYRYGYQRFDTPTMMAVIALLVAVVAVIQWAGDYLAKRLDKR